MTDNLQRLLWFVFFLITLYKLILERLGENFLFGKTLGTERQIEK
jgi:hypothetical protein